MKPDQIVINGITLSPAEIQIIKTALMTLHNLILESRPSVDPDTIAANQFQLYRLQMLKMLFGVYEE